MSNVKIGCTSLDCPERRGDACRHDLEGTLDNLVRDISKAQPMSKSEARHRVNDLIAEELRQVRNAYDMMEFLDPKHILVTWRGWKGIRNVLTDRIEVKTGSRI